MTRLTQEERIWIAFWHRLGKSGRQIGELIDRCHTDVNRELRRNAGRLGYCASRAQGYAERRAATRHGWTKLGKDPRLKRWVIRQLQEDWSPEQVSGRLRRQPPPEGHGQRLCHESIYQFIYHEEGQRLGLWRHLRRHRPQRRSWRKRRTRPTLISERTSIHERPEAVTDRIEVGHGESDTVEGARRTKGSLSVQKERVLQLARLHKIASHTADETVEALRHSVESLPNNFWKTMTFDNGLEGAKHSKLTEEYGIQTYFCDPYSSWQKGSVENLNGLVRQYFPKRCDFSQITNQMVYDVQEKLNNRPRKILGYRTPNEALKAHLETQTGALAS